VRFAHRHRVDELVVENGAVVGVRGSVLEPTSAARGVASSRNTVGEFEFRASAVIRRQRRHRRKSRSGPAELAQADGRVPEQLLSGVPRTSTDA